MIDRHKIYGSSYLAGCVKRYHTWPMIKEQTIGHHCWRVACIYIEIFQLPRAEVLYFIMHHDSGEMYAGDVPFNRERTPELKKLVKEVEAAGLRLLEIKLPELTKEELIKVKICDLLEMHETGEHERNLGNKYADPIIRDTMYEAQRIARESCMSMHVNQWLERRGSSLYVR